MSYITENVDPSEVVFFDTNYPELTEKDWRTIRLLRDDYSDSTLEAVAEHAARDEPYEGYDFGEAEQLSQFHAALIGNDEELQQFSENVANISRDAYGILVNLLAYGAQELSTNTAGFTMYVDGLDEVMAISDEQPNLYGLASHVADVRAMIADANRSIAHRALFPEMF